MAIKTPAGTRSSTMLDKFPYRVSVPPDHSQISHGLERWRWLSAHVGTLGTDWDIIISTEPHDAIIYLFQTQETAAEFVLAWL